MFRLGITGTIASGKSTVSRILAGLGVRIIDADIVAREVVEPGTKGAAMIREAFGGEYFFDDGSLNRKKLGALVFSDEEKLDALNAICRPLILGDISDKLERIERAVPYAVAAVDAALLVEYGMAGDFDEVWLVTASDEQRIERMAKRDGLTREQALLRIASQLSDAEKRRCASRVIDNSGCEEDTGRAVCDALRSALIAAAAERARANRR